MIEAGKPLLVLLSGGADSVCLLHVALEAGADVSALHVNYGLRDSADADEAFCRELFPSVIVERVRLEPGNMQARAREVRYALAEQHAVGDYATGHTLSDQAETVLMRLCSSPGRTGLLGMAPRRGRLIRPLLHMTREETREYCRRHGLSWREDPTNADTSFTRARVRHELLPLLERVAPGAERTIAETARLLRDEAEALDALLPDTNDLEELRELHPALARLALRRLAGAPIRTGEILEASPNGTVTLDVGHGLRAVIEYGKVRFDTGEETTPPAPQAVNAGCFRFGDWEVEVTEPATVRTWQPGDRIGSKKLQDLFVDNKVPRAQRQLIPVVERQGEVVCVGDLAGRAGFRARRLG